MKWRFLDFWKRVPFGWAWDFSGWDPFSICLPKERSHCDSAESQRTGDHLLRSTPTPWASRTPLVAISVIPGIPITAEAVVRVSGHLMASYGLSAADAVGETDS